MSWLLKLAVVLGIFANSAIAKSVQISNNEVDEFAMTAEEEEFFMKLVTVILKAQTTDRFGIAAGNTSLESLYPTSGQCSVSGQTVSCSFDFEFDIHVLFFKKHISINGGISVEYLPSKNVFRLRATIGGATLIDKDISAENPPAICVGVPVVPKLVSVCFQVSDINISSSGSFHACFAISAKAFGVTLASHDFGCINTI